MKEALDKGSPQLLLRRSQVWSLFLGSLTAHKASHLDFPSSEENHAGRQAKKYCPQHESPSFLDVSCSCPTEFFPPVTKPHKGPPPSLKSKLTPRFPFEASPVSGPLTHVRHKLARAHEANEQSDCQKRPMWLFLKTAPPNKENKRNKNNNKNTHTNTHTHQKKETTSHLVASL